MIKVVNDDKYKIGVSARPNVNKRFAAIQSSCPYILSIYATCSGYVSEEAQIHLALKDYHLTGEWFQLPIHIANRLKRLFIENEIRGDSVQIAYKLFDAQPKTLDELLSEIPF